MVTGNINYNHVTTSSCEEQRCSGSFSYLWWEERLEWLMSPHSEASWGAALFSLASVPAGPGCFWSHFYRWPLHIHPHSEASASPFCHLAVLLLSRSHMQTFPRETLTGLSLSTMKLIVGTQNLVRSFLASWFTWQLLAEVPNTSNPPRLG